MKCLIQICFQRILNSLIRRLGICNGRVLLKSAVSTNLTVQRRLNRADKPGAVQFVDEAENVCCAVIEARPKARLSTHRSETCMQLPEQSGRLRREA